MNDRLPSLADVQSGNRLPTDDKFSTDNSLLTGAVFTAEHCDKL